MDSAPNSNSGLNFLKSLTILVVMFGVGFSGAIAYYRLFVPPTPPVSAGQLLGVSDSIAEPSETPAPPPNLSLIPNEIEKPLKGSIAYLKGNQIYQVNADRTQNIPLTTDSSQKEGLVVSPDGQTLAYISTETTNNAKAYNINLYNLKTKKTESLLTSASDIYQNLIFSPDSGYLSAWNRNGQEAIILDTKSKAVPLKYSTDDQSGVSPIVWIPVSPDAISFILKGELFTGTINGTGLKSLSKDVVGVKTNSENKDLPVVPVWSQNGRFVSYLKKNGLYLYDLDTQTETAVVKANKDFDLDKIPYRAIAFTQPASDLIYQSLPDQNGKNIFIYSQESKQNKPLTGYGETGFLDSANYTLLGLTDTETIPHLSGMNLDKSAESICDAESQSYPLPVSLDALDPAQKALITLTHETDVYALKIVNHETCDSYDLIRSTSTLESPVWLTQ